MHHLWGLGSENEEQVKYQAAHHELVRVNNCRKLAHHETVK